LCGRGGGVDDVDVGAYDGDFLGGGLEDHVHFHWGRC
jgi:hypothetical protein